MGVEKQNRVVVTHFINPHLFWFRYIGEPGNEYTRMLLNFESKLQNLYHNKAPNGKLDGLRRGDKVAVNCLPFKQYIQAEVLKNIQFDEEQIILWITHYGFPLLTNREHIRRLPTNIEIPVSQVHCGGIANLQPAETVFNYLERNLVVEKKYQWQPKACEKLQNLLIEASTIIFKEKLKTIDNHRWGDLVMLSNKGQQINASTYLKNAKYAIEVGPEFPQICLKYITTKKAPWLTNNNWSNVVYNVNKMEQSNDTQSVIKDENAEREINDWCSRNELQQERHALDIKLNEPKHASNQLLHETIPIKSSSSVSSNSSLTYCAIRKQKLYELRAKYAKMIAESHNNTT